MRFASAIRRNHRLWIVALGAAAAFDVGTGTTSIEAAPTDETIYFAADEVSRAFSKGMPLIEKGNYKVHASRREEPGKVEVHHKDTDIIYVLEGSADFVTGGTMTGGTNIGPEEVRGTSVEGGTMHHLVPGDVIIVPRNTPHWFKAVQGPLLYYTVKVPS
jgi:mannose-6-phosphate isomerase-like protein (cupin superfamily)